MTEQDLSGKTEIKTSPPSLHFIKMTEEEAFNYCNEIKAKAEEWKQKKYEVSAPKELEAYFQPDSQMQAEEFRNIFHRWFTNWDISQETSRLQACKEIFEKGIATYLPLQEWDFRIPDQYNVIVTPCSIGAGGAGHWQSKWGPIITMYYCRDWTKSGDRTPAETLLHEAYHLGIDGIIDGFGFGYTPEESQKIRERIVDICSREVLVPGVLSTTHIQHSKQQMIIDSYLNRNNLSVFQRLTNYKGKL